MFSPHDLRFEPKIVGDFVGPEGATVTHVRGSLLIVFMQLLTDMGERPRFLRVLPTQYHEMVEYTLAASWVPASDFIAFFAALDETFADDEQLRRLGEQLGDRISKSLFGALLNSLRPAGSEEGIWLGVKHAERMWPRIYKGGGCTLTQVGPKDLLFEVHGLPFASSRCFQVLHAAFMRGLFLTMTKTCFVKPKPGRSRRAHAFTIQLSWV